ncbi:MAG TPA: outer membrane beta-barrel domain-containing protein [Polyangiaceae bacterium]|nr:outer membrane beta-barrel domain-containing protein [Polyangiaceae bacterium]
MKKSCIGLLIAALGAIPTTGFAQVKVGAKAEAGATIDADAEGADAKADAKTGADAKGTGDTAAAGEGDLGAGGEGVGDICKIDPSACPVLDMKKEAARPIKESIYAVQQLYVMRARRFEFNPWWNLRSLNDQFVQHAGPGVALTYFINNVFAIGANFRYYAPFNADSAFNGQVRRAARVAVPLNEYQWGASLDFNYVFAYGKFAGFGDFIFEYDAYVLGGVGALSTRPIAVIDPDNRNFAYEPKLAADAGLGLRVFFSRWFAVNVAVKDYIYPEKLESLTVNEPDPSNKNSWVDKNPKLTNDVELQAGVSIFVPFSFDYRLPK